MAAIPVLWDIGAGKIIILSPAWAITQFASFCIKVDKKGLGMYLRANTLSSVCGATTNKQI